MDAELTPLGVVVETPQHSGLGHALDYLGPPSLVPGTLVRVPLGRRDVPGIVWDRAAQAPAGTALRPLREALTALPPFDADWRRLVGFAAA